MPPDYRARGLSRAMTQLEERGFITRARDDGTPHSALDRTFDQIQDHIARTVGGGGRNPFVAPTPIGERLITALTGHEPVEPEIPPLPEPTWGG